MRERGLELASRCLASIGRLGLALGRRGWKIPLAIVLVLAVVSPIFAYTVVPQILAPNSTAGSPTAAPAKREIAAPTVINPREIVARPADQESLTISGSISAEAGPALAAITITAYDLSGNPVGSPASTAADGSYSLSLPAGTYTIGASDPAGVYGAGRWTTATSTGFTSDSGTASSVTLAAAPVTGINASLPKATLLTGTIVDPVTGPLVGFEVDIYDPSGAQVPIPASSAITLANGAYAVPVAPGTYVVGFKDPTESRAGGYWTYSGISYTFADAARMNVASVKQGVLSLAVPNNNHPGRASGVTATPGNTLANVYWSAAPANGFTVSSYIVTSSPEGRTCTWSSGPLTCVVSGLTNGQGYTFTVVASNKLGPGSASDPSSSVTPATVPGQPGSVQATPGYTTATVTWSAPSDGGSAITSYRATSAPGSKFCTSSGLSCQVLGLTNGTSYTFTVTATNVMGTGQASGPSSPVTPTVTPPDPPSGVTATFAGVSGVAGNVSVSWTAPASNGSPITGYTATSSPGGQTCATSGSLSCSVVLTSGGTYSFTVTARNSIGTSAPSAPSSPIGVVTGGTFHPIALTRVVDTRTSKGATKLVSRTVQHITFAGANNIPSGATAVTGTMAVMSGATYKGYVTIAPTLTSGVTPPTSTDNFGLNATRSDGFTIGLSGSTADVMFWCTSTGSSVTVDMVIDVSGYYSNDAAGYTYHQLSGGPIRMIDTRNGTGGIGPLHGVTRQPFTVAGAGTVPSNAVAVTGTVTALPGTPYGFITAGPSLSTTPPTSTVNFASNDNRATNMTVALYTGTAPGQLDFVFTPNSHLTTDTVNFIFDVSGYFTLDVTGSAYHPLATLVRAFDSSTSGRGAFVHGVKQWMAVAPYSTVIPGNATGTTANVTVVAGSVSGSVAVYPNLTWPPVVGTVNFPASDTASDGVTCWLAGGTVDGVYWSSNGSGSVRVLLDVSGYFAP